MLSYGFCLGEENSKSNSADFSGAFRALLGDGVCKGYGDEYAVLSTTSRDITLETGFALVGGRWAENDEEMTLTVAVPDNKYDRYDAVILRSDTVAKTVAPVVVTGRASVFPRQYEPVRNDAVYEIVLCHIFVPLGSTQVLPEHIIDTRPNKDICGIIESFATVANQISYIYNFLTSGIDERVQDLIDKSNNIILDGEDVIAAIEQATALAGIKTEVGEIQFLATVPADGWLECNGQEVPQEHPELLALMERTPNIHYGNENITAWIYAGKRGEISV